MDYLAKYQEYLKSVKSKLNPNEYIRESSQKSYFSQLKNIANYFISRGFTDKFIYEIDNLELLKKLDKLFYTDEELRDKNDKGQNQYSVAFHHYIRMISKINDLEYDFEEIYHTKENEEIIKKIKSKKINHNNLTNESSNKESYVNVIKRKRSPDVAAYTRQRANGVCDLCGQKAPFIDKNGIPYLESHHLVTLSEGGPDVIFNTVALCPNCHRKMHMLDSCDDKKFLKDVLYKYLLDEDERQIIEKFDELFDKFEIK